jgi:hypothetical protein
MMKGELLKKLEQHVAGIAAYHRQIKALTQRQVRKPEMKMTAATIARDWFSDVVPALRLRDFQNRRLKLPRIGSLSC